MISSEKDRIYRFLISPTGDLLILVILVQTSNSLGERWFQKLSEKRRKDKGKTTCFEVQTNMSFYKEKKRISHIQKLWRYFSLKIRICG